MDFDEAIEIALKTWYPKDDGLHFNPHHPLGKLLGEWGELLDDYMKSLYKPGYIFEPEDELGDIWYYLRILCYQKKIYPRKIDYIVFPEINVIINFQDDNTDILIKSAIYNMAQNSLIIEKNSKSMIYPELSMACQISIIIEIARRYNLTLDDLTHSNWEKLKPGSERGGEWMKTRG